MAAAKAKAASTPKVKAVAAEKGRPVGNGNLAKIEGAMKALAVLIEGMLPARASVKERAAAEYWGASVVNAISEAWRNKAKKDATAHGVLPDYAKTPFSVGTSETVYVGSLVTVSLKVTPQADKLDVLGLLADLEKLSIPPATLKRLVRKHMRSFPGAHVFTASLS